MDNLRKSLFALGLLPVVLAVSCRDADVTAPESIRPQSDILFLATDLTPMESVGEAIFFDEALSLNQNQSCASCHDPAWGFSGPDSYVNAHGSVYEGSVPSRFGNRRPPSAAYATPSPILHYIMEKDDALFVGGNFWDGRASGELLGNPAADQAQGPFLNPVEQGLPDAACVVYRVCENSGYGEAFQNSATSGICEIAWPVGVSTTCATEGATVELSEQDRGKVWTAYDDIALLIEAFEASPAVNAFSSKYDAYLLGMADLTKEERFGLQMFKAKGKCANCHILDAGPSGEPPLLTDFTFDNLGVPRNPENPWYEMPEQFNSVGEEWVDMGLGGFLANRGDYSSFAEDNWGKQKVPTLRNVDLRPGGESVKAFAHNGYFKSLEQIVHFYNTRDAKDRCPDPLTPVAVAMAQNCWPAPEVDENVNSDELGNLHLTDDQEKAIVAFLRTLSDGYF